MSQRWSLPRLISSPTTSRIAPAARARWNAVGANAGSRYARNRMSIPADIAQLRTTATMPP
jgi:hypothetical protein